MVTATIGILHASSAAFVVLSSHHLISYPFKREPNFLQQQQLQAAAAEKQWRISEQHGPYVSRER
jgi:hypothetical protein